MSNRHRAALVVDRLRHDADHRLSAHHRHRAVLYPTPLRDRRKDAELGRRHRMNPPGRMGRAQRLVKACVGRATFLQLGASDRGLLRQQSLNRWVRRAGGY